MSTALGIGLGMGLQFQAPPPAVSSLGSINAAGWYGTWDAGLSSDFTPHSSPLTVSVTSPGYDTSGNVTTVARSITWMQWIRQAYPNQASDSAGDGSLSEHIYSGDTVGSWTNNSTLAYPKPFGMWVTPDHEVERGSSTTLYFFAASHFGRNGKPLACIEWTASDGTNPDQTGTITALTTVAWSASGYSAPCYAITIDNTAFDDGPITVDVVMCPWVGSQKWSTATDYYTRPDIRLTSHKYFNDNGGTLQSDSRIFAAVDGIGGGTPACASTQAAALTNPYASIAAAMAGLSAIHGNARGCEIIIKDGTTLDIGSSDKFASGSSTGGDDNAPVMIRGEDSGAIAAGTTFRDDGSSAINTSVLPVKSVFKWLNIEKQYTGMAAGTAILFDIGNFTWSTLVVRDCNFVGTETVDVDTEWFLRTGRTYFYNNTNQNRSTSGQFGTTNFKNINIVGCEGDTCVGPSVYNFLGCKSLNAQYTTPALGAYFDPAYSCIGAFSFLGNNGGTGGAGASAPISMNRDLGSHGIAFTNLVLENANAGNVIGLAICEPGTVQADAYYLSQITVAGSRTNIFYNDDSNESMTRIAMFNCVHLGLNTKSDVFATDGTYDNNWSVIFRVDHAGCYVNADDSGSAPSVFGRGANIGEEIWLEGRTGTNASPIDPEFVSDKSVYGIGGGDGDYRPDLPFTTESEALHQVSANHLAYPIDFLGTTLALDGTDYAGALQP